MNSFQAHIFNVFILIIFGGWAILAEYDAIGPNVQVTTFVPLVAGIFLLLLSPWIAKEKNRSLLIAVCILIILLVYFYKPLINATGEPKIRILVQILTCIWAIIFMIKNLVTNRINKSEPTKTDLPI